MIRFAIGLLMVLLTFNSVSAQSPVRVMTGYAATSGPHAILWMAREAGLFDKNGIKAVVAYIRSGATICRFQIPNGAAQLTLSPPCLGQTQTE